MRVLFAGILGGIAMFVWTAIAHVATPLGMIGFSAMPNEAAVLDTMKESAGQTGLFFFPYPDIKDPNWMQKRAESLRSKPWGWMIYHPPGGGEEMTAATLAGEFAKETVQSLIAAFLLSMSVLAGFGTRVAFVTLIGVSAGIATNASQFIWYGFPLDYTLAQIFIEVMAGLFAGVAIAFWLGRKPA
jgi:hypothetical protein